MGVGSRPAACTSCSKRLNRKSWYYRNGQFFCKKRCFVTHQEKAASEKAKAAEAAAATPQEPATEAPSSA